MNGPAWLAQDEPLITDWMQGWGSVLGLGVSLIAIAVTASLLVHEIREARRGRRAASLERVEAQQDRELARRDRELAAQERADAQMAHARAVASHNVGLMRQGGIVEGGEVSVTNYGAGPILDVHVMLDSPSPGLVLLKKFDVLAPGDTTRIDAYRIDLEGGKRIQDGEVTVVLWFTDMAGLRWERRGNDQPVRLLAESDTVEPGGRTEIQRSTGE